MFNGLELWLALLSLLKYPLDVSGKPGVAMTWKRLNIEMSQKNGLIKLI